MTTYRLPDWLGGQQAHLIQELDNRQVIVEPWMDGRPSGHQVTVSAYELTRLPNPDDPTPAQVLATPMGPNDAGASTMRGYLVELLLMLWRQGGGFSGKRPFGNSGWEWELYQALAAQGYVATTTDRYGELEPDRQAADELIVRAIEALAGGAS